MTRTIYMLSQCKDAKSNSAAVLARMRRRELSVFFAREQREWRELKNLNFGGYSRRVNQSGACSSSDVITSGGRKSETTMEDKLIVVVWVYPELYIRLHTFTKTGIHFDISNIHNQGSRVQLKQTLSTIMVISSETCSIKQLNFC